MISNLSSIVAVIRRKVCCKFHTYSRLHQQETIMNVFDRKAKLLHRERTALDSEFDVYNYLKKEIDYRIADRVFDVKRKFKVAVELGCGRPSVGSYLDSEAVELLYQCDLSPGTLHLSEVSESVPTFKVVADEEFIPFASGKVDIFVSSMALHWVNDLPGCFIQVHNALKNDGVFIGAMFGGETLYELRCSLQLAEIEREGGFAPHISPFTEVRDLGNLLNRSKFTMITLDIDEIKINYPSMIELLIDLKGMGENNCSWNRKSHLHRDTILAACAIYKSMYGNEDGSVPATFQILYFIGWKPDPSQPKAAERGSATVSLKDLDKINQLLKEKK